MQDPPSALAREFGQLVHDRRSELGLTQAEPAERCGMKQPQIFRCEGGGTVPTLPLLRFLARVCRRTTARIRADQATPVPDRPRAGLVGGLRTSGGPSR
jgi:transcriptional regulator with XRE-family HTH domain